MPKGDMMIDLVTAFGSGAFGWSSGSFNVLRSHGGGLYATGPAWSHCWSVDAHHRTRDSLIAGGWIERIPAAHGSKGINDLRLSLKTLNAYQSSTDAPSVIAWREHRAMVK